MGLYGPRPSLSLFLSLFLYTPPPQFQAVPSMLCCLSVSQPISLVPARWGDVTLLAKSNLRCLQAPPPAPRSLGKICNGPGRAPPSRPAGMVKTNTNTINHKGKDFWSKPQKLIRQKKDAFDNVQIRISLNEDTMGQICNETAEWDKVFRMFKINRRGGAWVV